MAIAAVLSSPAAPGLRGLEAAEIVPGHYFMQLKLGVPAAAAARAHGVAVDYVSGRTVNGYAGFIPPGLLARGAAHPRIETVIPDRVLSSQARPGSGGGTTDEVIPAGVMRVGGTTRMSGTSMAVPHLAGVPALLHQKFAR